ncbi:Uncharacterised protein [Mycolicibacterium gilvum]|uniref:HNH endonuclease n=1 Tax=Mycolicibacterium gilvum TaxID=1804 RepID=A0A378SIN5_9MYCO|nr:Uncharacterised protein [Mycolicibacterium gilvum]
MTLKPCIDCGVPSASTRCSAHRGYDAAWTRLSQRARKLQRFCSDCGATENLQADHSPEAWARRAAGKRIRLKDIDVVCGPCNTTRGQARPDPLQHNHTRRSVSGGMPRAKAQARPPSREADYTPLGGMR